MTEEEKFETQVEAISREAREDRDAATSEILRNMSDFLSRYSVDFSLPWIVDAGRQVKDIDDLKSGSEK